MRLVNGGRFVELETIGRRIISANPFIIVPSTAELSRLFQQLVGMGRIGQATKVHGVNVPGHLPKKT